MAGLVAGKSEIVTGGGSGLGRAIAVLFAAEGGRVAVSDRDQQSAESTAAEIKRAGGQAIAIVADITSPPDMQRLVETATKEFGRLDCAVNNAGIEGKIGPADSYDDGDWARVIEINLIGTFVALKQQLKQMLANGGGSIVNVASTAGYRGAPRMSAYTASKHGIVGLTKSIALEYAGRNIRVNAVCPGSFWTPMSGRIWGDTFEETIKAQTPMARAAHVDEIARPIVNLLSDTSSWITGAALPIDGGKCAR